MPRADGYIESIDFDGRRHEADTLQCVHCQAHYVVRPGSGKTRGWCPSCAGPTCGRRGCAVCVPAQRRLQLMESAEGRRKLRALIGAEYR